MTAGAQTESSFTCSPSHLLSCSAAKPLGLWLLLGVGATALVFSGVVQGGMGWDEPEQIHAGASYTHWFTDATDRLSDATIRQFWTWDPAHPPLGKLFMGVMVRLLGGVLGPLSAARIAPALALGATITLLSIWTQRELGARAALLAGVSLLFFPRVFGAAHFASLDTPMMLAWLLAVVTFGRALRTSPAAPGLRAALSPAALLAGVGFGLALLTKLNALFLPLVLWPWALVRYRRRAFGPILASLILGPLLFLVGWPWLYHDTVARTMGYLADKVGRPVLPVWYLGRAYLTTYAPWHYPLVMVAVTVPAGLLAGAAVGIVAVVGRWRRAAVAELSLVNLAGILMVASLPWAPKYDGVRLFLPAFPFLAILAGVGLDGVYRRLNACSGPWRRALLVTGVGLMLTQGWGLIWAWPFHLTYYNMVVGGRQGAKALGLETMYWGEAFDRESWRGLEDVVARADSPHGERSAGRRMRVSFAGVAREVPEFLQTRGYLTRDFAPLRLGAGDADYVVVARSQGWLARSRRLDLLEPTVIEQALFVRRHRGMPLCWILSREAAAPSVQAETVR